MYTVICDSFDYIIKIDWHLAALITIFSLVQLNTLQSEKTVSAKKYTEMAMRLKNWWEEIQHVG